MSKRYVHIVMRGEKSEGGSIQGVYVTLRAAKAAALALKPCFEGGWEGVGDEPFTRWENGCDFVEIEAYEVKKS